MSMDKTVDSQIIIKAIDGEIKRLISERYDVLKKEFVEKLERDKATELAGLSLFLMKNVNLSSIGETITITLRTENK